MEGEGNRRLAEQCLGLDGCARANCHVATDWRLSVFSAAFLVGGDVRPQEHEQCLVDLADEGGRSSAKRLGSYLLKVVVLSRYPTAGRMSCLYTV